ncbi:hypothetical protein ACH47Z_39305 [Streptomyces sp. NPDC020192]|uniref:hypothetical protein n=1 Tax=Streptomyces sp. NPDC020192 TaxID=3365066 RepID=UPI0037919C20
MGNGQHVSYKAAGSRPQSVTARPAAGPTALLEIAGLRLLTDDVAGVPVQHCQDGSQHVTGGATGFTLTGTDMRTVYISAVVERFGPVDLALLPVDAARTPPQDGYPMLTGDQAAEAATRLDARRVAPLPRGISGPRPMHRHGPRRLRPTRHGRPSDRPRNR